MVMMHLAKGATVEAATTQVEASNAYQNTEANTNENTEANAEDTVTDSERVEQLKGFLKRLGTGEDLGSVREDFASQFAC